MESTEKFTADEFEALPRNADGDIIDLNDVFLRFTPEQVFALSEDDYSRFDEYTEELFFLAAEFA